MDALLDFIRNTGFALIGNDWRVLVMLAISCVLLYLAIVKKFEPLLLLPIAFGMLLTNLPGANMFHEELFVGGHVHWNFFGGEPVTQEAINSIAASGGLSEIFATLNEVLKNGGSFIVGSDFIEALKNGGVAESIIATLSEGTVLNAAAIESLMADIANDSLPTLAAIIGTTITPGLLDVLYLGVKLGVYPCLIFIGVGAMTDFGPLIANPKSMLLGAAAQLGIFITYVAATLLLGFTPQQAGAIGIIGGADGPTAIYTTMILAAELLGPIAVAAYSYMALIGVIQPPIMKALTTKKERSITMRQLRPVSKTEKIIFPIVVTIFVTMLVPSAGPLIGSLMLGNLIKESGVCERLSKTAQNELMNIVTIFLGVSVGATATAATFLTWRTIGIIAMGVVAFSMGTAGGVLLAKFMNLFLKDKINPLIGSAGVSAVPMAARVSQKVGQEENPGNFLLMHAMGPNVAGVIGSAIAAGVLISLLS